MPRTITIPANAAPLSSSDMRNQLQILENEIASGTDPGHLHTIAALSVTGVPSSSTFLRGDGSWAATPQGTVTSVSVISANGFAGSVATGTTTPAITLTTTITGVLQGNGTALSAAPTTGSGNVVLSTSPTLTTPNLGMATATSINGLTITSSTGTLTITNGKTVSFSNSITFSGTDSTTMTFPTTTATIARTDAGQTFTGVQVFISPKIITKISDTNGNDLIAITATASAVNTIAITNAATGNAPTLGVGGASSDSNAGLIIQAKGTGAINLNSGSYNTIQTYSPGAGGTATLDLSKGNIHHITMPAGNITIALSNTTAGQCFIVRILQDSGGSRTVTWFTTIKWAGGSPPTLTTTANKADTMGFEVTTAGSSYDGYVVGQNI